MNKDLISGLEKLARLQLSETERARLGADLERILEFVDRLKMLDTTGVEPLVYLNEEAILLRDDVVGAHLSREEALGTAPEQDGQFFTLPKVIE